VARLPPLLRSLILAATSANSPEFVPGMHYNPRGPLGCAIVQLLDLSF
jgi:hypothetical protein